MSSIIVIFVITIDWKQTKYSSVEEWLDKLGNINKIKYYIAMEKLW